MWVGGGGGDRGRKGANVCVVRGEGEREEKSEDGREVEGERKRGRKGESEGDLGGRWGSEGGKSEEGRVVCGGDDGAAPAACRVRA